MTSETSAYRRAFLRQFPDEESAETWLVARRWPDGVACGSCGSPEVRRMKTRDGWWHCSTCKHQTSVRSGTPLHGSRKPLRDWVYVIFCASRYEATSAKQLQRDLGYKCYETAWTMAQKVRAALHDDGAPLLDAGPGVELVVNSALFVPCRRAAGDPLRPCSMQVTVCVEAPAFPLPVTRAHVAVSDATDASWDDLTEAMKGWCAKAGVVASHAEAVVDDDNYERARLLRGRTRGSLHEFSIWLNVTHEGVSRRYLANYAAQWLFAWQAEAPSAEAGAARSTGAAALLAARVVREPFRPRNDLAGARLLLPGEPVTARRWRRWPAERRRR